MSDYTKRLYKFINGKIFVRCFYGKCPECGKHIFSIGDDVVDNSKIKAKFICDCGKKWKEIVYSKKYKHYKYRQAIVIQYKDDKKIMNVLKLNDVVFKVTENSIKSEKFESKKKVAIQ